MSRSLVGCCKAASIFTAVTLFACSASPTTGTDPQHFKASTVGKADDADCGGATCTADQFCNHDTDCKNAGMCDGLPQSCDDKPDASDSSNASDPVCGCDGQTYEDACHAHLHGISVAHDGECGDGGTPEADAGEK